MGELVWPDGFEYRGASKPRLDLWTRDESRPDPNDPTMLLVTRLRFKSIAWKCGSCRKKGRTAIVPYDDPDPLVPASCFGSC